MGEIYFYTKKRARLYFSPEGIDGRIQAVSNKYQHEKCRVESEDVVFDVGANIGEFSISLRDTTQKIYCFEPDPVARAALEANAKHFKSFQVFPWALGETQGDGQFFLSSNDADSSTIMPENYTSVITVKNETLAGAMKQFGLDRVNFLKLEAEGYEPEILKGAGEHLRKFDKVAVDVSPERQGESPAKEVIELLEKAGFNVWQERSIVFATRSD